MNVQLQLPLLYNSTVIYIVYNKIIYGNTSLVLALLQRVFLSLLMCMCMDVQKARKMLNFHKISFINDGQIINVVNGGGSKAYIEHTCTSIPIHIAHIYGYMCFIELNIKG